MERGHVDNDLIFLSRTGRSTSPKIRKLKRRHGCRHFWRRDGSCAYCGRAQDLDK